MRALVLTFIVMVLFVTTTEKILDTYFPKDNGITHVVSEPLVSVHFMEVEEWKGYRSPAIVSNND